MRKHILLTVGVLAIAGNLLGQPTILQPNTSTDLEAAFGINVSVVPGASVYTIELGLNGVFLGVAPDYQVQVGGTRYFYVNGLTYGANYTIRVSSDVAPGVYNTKAITVKAAPLTNITNVTNGESVTTNKRFFTKSQHLTTSYEWEFNTQSDFSGTGVDQFLASTTVNNYLVQPGLLQPGTTYYGRTRAIIGSQSLTGPWTDEWDSGLVVNFNTGQPVVSFFQPTDTTDKEATFDIIVAPLTGATTYTIELGKDSVFSGSSPDYQAQTGTSRTFEVDSLTYGGNYYIRATTDNDGLGIRNVTIKPEPQTFVTNINNGDTLPLTPSTRFFTKFQHLTTSYEWEFNTQSDFSGTGADQFLVSTSVNNYLLNPAVLQAETEYFVRTRSIIGSQSLTGPWTDEWDAGSVVNFFTPELGLNFITPATYEDLEASFLISVNAVQGASTYTLEIGKDSVFSGPAPDYQTKTSASRFFTVTGLDYGGTYFIRATADVLGGSWRTEQVTIKPLPETWVTNIADNTYFNDTASVDFITKAQHLTTTYDWEFNTMSDFSGTGMDLYATSTATNTLNLDFDNLQPGTQYYVRTRSNIGSQSLTGMWSNELDPDRSITIFTPLEIKSVWAPEDAEVLDRTSFKAWVEPVNGATAYTFQLSDDPGFSSIIDQQDANKHWINGGLVDGFDPAADYHIYDFFGKEVELQRDTDYWLRVKGYNANQTGNFGGSVQIDTGLPVSFVKNIADGAMDINTNVLLQFQIIPQTSEYAVQISTTSDFSADVMEFTNLPTSLYVQGLAYGTTYYTRVRIDSDPWGDVVVSFTTVNEPAAMVTFPTEGQTGVPLNMQFNATPHANANYDWEVDTQSDFMSGSKIEVSGVTNKVQFTGQLSNSTVYWVRVRAVVPSESITGPWSTAVMFTTVSAPENNDDGDISTANDENSLSNTKAYPNPFDKEFRIQLPESTDNVSLVLYNSFGNIVYTLENKSQVDLDNLSFGKDLHRGIYLLRIFDNNSQEKITTLQLLKE